MDFQLDQQQAELYETAGKLADVFRQRARVYDDGASFPAENIDDLREAGFLKLTVPTDLGGHGLWGENGSLAFYLVLEAIASGCASTAQLLQIHTHCVGDIARLANDEQRVEMLSDVVSDGALIASGGNILGAIRSGKVASGEGVLRPAADGGFRLTYTSPFASLAPFSDKLMIFALAPGSTSPAEGYQMVVVPTKTPGVTFEDTWDVLGMRPTVSWTIHLNDVEVQPHQLVGGPGDLVQRSPRTWTLAYAANHLGVADGVVEFLRQHMRDNPFLQADGVANFTFGRMVSRLQAARTSLWYAAWLWEQDKFDEAELASLRSLHVAKETVLYVTDQAFEVCGARAVGKDMPLELAYRDTRVWTLHDRESNNMKRLVAAELGGEFHSKQQFGAKLTNSTEH